MTIEVTVTRLDVSVSGSQGDILVEVSDGILGGNSRVKTNRGAVGLVTFDLINETGWYFDFRVVAEQFLKCKAPGGSSIRFGPTLSADGGFVQSNTIGDAWRIECIYPGEFWVTNAQVSGLGVDL